MVQKIAADERPSDIIAGKRKLERNEQRREKYKERKLQSGIQVETIQQRDEQNKKRRQRYHVAGLGMTGKCLLSTMQERKKIQCFVFCIGDDRSDEDMLKNLHMLSCSEKFDIPFPFRWFAIEEKSMYQSSVQITTILGFNLHISTHGVVYASFGNVAYNSMDNGLLSFDHVRIPRDQMLMRVLQFSREGKCTQFDVLRQLIYGTMVYVRQTIVSDASAVALSRAVTIATRCNCVHRQFGSQIHALPLILLLIVA